MKHCSRVRFEALLQSSLISNIANITLLLCLFYSYHRSRYRGLLPIIGNLTCSAELTVAVCFTLMANMARLILKVQRQRKITEVLLRNLSVSCIGGFACSRNSADLSTCGFVLCCNVHVHFKQIPFNKYHNETQCTLSPVHFPYCLSHRRHRHQR